MTDKNEPFSYSLTPPRTGGTGGVVHRAEQGARAEPPPQTYPTRQRAGVGVGNRGGGFCTPAPFHTHTRA